MTHSDGKIFEDSIADNSLLWSECASRRKLEIMSRLSLTRSERSLTGETQMETTRVDAKVFVPGISDEMGSSMVVEMVMKSCES